MVFNALPVCLPATPVTLPANAPTGYYNSQYGIKNTEPVGVLIDKIVFSGTDELFGVLGATFSAARIELKWRNELITGIGPVALLGVSWPQNSGAEDYTAMYRSTISVKFAKPFYLPPGDVISVSYLNDLMVTGNTPITIYAMAIGQQCPSPPRERWIPYLADFLSQPYVAGSGAVISDQSTPVDLGNPFDTPLVIERLIGRALGYGASISPAWNDSGLELFWWDYNVRISDHRDNWWVSTAAPLPSVFSAVDRSWIIHHTLEPKGFLRVDVEGTASNVGSLGDVTQTRAVIGLVGSRRIA